MSSMGHIKSVNEFLSDLTDAVKDTPWPQALAQALPWIEPLGEAVADSVAPIKFLLKLHEKLTSVDDPNELGYLACTIAFQRSVQQALGQLPLPRKDVAAKASQPLAKSKTKRSYDFSTFSDETSKAHPFYRDSMKALDAFCRRVGLSDVHERLVKHQVAIRFTTNLQLILANRETEEKFGPFLRLIQRENPDRAYQALTKHANYQRWLYEERRVLGEPFALQHVYVETDCGDLTWGQIDASHRHPSSGPDGKARIEPFVDHADHGGRHNLLGRVLEILGDPDFKDAIIIQGHAGSGKSSFTLRLCQKLLDEGLQPIRIELKNLDTGGTKDIAETLPAAAWLGEPTYDPFADRYDFTDGLFRDDRIFDEATEFGKATIGKYVLILDAWDEISVGAELGYQQQVTKLLNRVRELYLRPTRRHPVRVILTGRPSDAVSQSHFLRDPSRILTVRPFTPEQLRAFDQNLRDALKARPIRDPGWRPWDLEGKAGLPQVFDRYEEEYQRTHSEGRSPQAEGDDASLEILGLPLLAHLAFRLMGACPGDVGLILANTTVLYRSLVDLIIGGGGKPAETRDETQQSAHLRHEELRGLLRGTAEAMTLVGSESISKKELAVRLRLHGDELDERVRTLDDEILSRLMVSFFFKGGIEQLGCEFSHKSFREYLYAEQVVEILKAFGRDPRPFDERNPKEYWKDFDARDPRHEWSRRLANVLGPKWITPEVGRTLTQLTEWEVGRAWGRDPLPRVGDATDPLTTDQWRRVRDGLADLWDWWGEGVPLRPQPGYDPNTGAHRFASPPLVLEVIERDRWLSRIAPGDPLPAPTRTATIDAHLGDGLFQLCADVHRAIAEAESPDPGSGHQGPPASDDEGGIGSGPARPRRYQDIREGDRPVVRFAPSGPSPEYFRLYIQRINGAGFRPRGDGYFPRAIKLKWINLHQEYLFFTYLHLTDLSGADLSGADLSRADLSRADLSGADLSRARLFRARLSRAVLSGADLSRADLSGADLSGADLSGADLSRARLSRADLSGADLSGADLSGADLSRADLSRARLSRARLSRADLSGADLSGADLSRADLSRADLSRADFEGAILSKEQLWDAMHVDRAVNLDKARYVQEDDSPDLDAKLDEP